jgi:ribosome maturation factor RimP
MARHRPQQHTEEGRVSQFQERQRLLEVLTPPADRLGLDLEAVEVSAAGRRRLLRVAVDKDGGVSLDDIAEATRALSGVLDESEAMGERAYTLEVTSPGVDRPLTLARHWRRNRDRLVAVTLRDGNSLTGRITGADEDAAVLDIGGTQRSVSYDEVAKAKVQVEFNRKEA